MIHKPLLGPEGLKAIDRALAQRPLLAFDFDGTLAPLVDHPDDARVPAALEPQLARLSELADVAIISGRALADLRKRLGFRPLHVVGNHGAEGGTVDPAEAAALAAQTDHLLNTLRAHLVTQRQNLDACGVEIEDKGRSLAIHYRRAPDALRARAAIDTALEACDPRLEIYGGHDVVNIVNAAAPDKGRALLAMVQAGGYGSALFVGDDVNDESVFSRALPDWVTARIGEAPESQAQWRLGSVAEMPALVDYLISRLASPADAASAPPAGN